MAFIITSLMAYLLGSLSSAIILCKLFGLPDPRTQGSGNAGATNILRTAGKKNALCVLLGDALKGILAVLIGRLVGVAGLELGLIALFVVVGHIFPIFFQFRGGKGVATALGVVIALSFWVGLFTVATWVVVALVFRYASLASMVAAAAAVLFMVMSEQFSYAIPLIGVAMLIFSKHWKNIERLRYGTESKINF